MLTQPDQSAAIPALLPARALGAVGLLGMTLSTLPPSSIVGAILWTGYFGDLVATHLGIL